MSLTDLAALGEAIGGIAVLITVLYLAYQLRQTTIIERTNGQRELLNRTRDWVELTTTNPELVDVLKVSLNDWDAASAEQKERASGWMLSAALQAEQALYMWRENLINESLIKAFFVHSLLLLGLQEGPNGGKMPAMQ
jgi:hypothetical protein